MSSGAVREIPLAEDDRRADRIRSLARMLDSAVRIPGTGISFGADSVFGLVPVVGDLAGAALSALLAPPALVIASAVGYATDHGYRDTKQRYGLANYLPDEAAEFVGFYRPEQGPDGEFRWMADRGVVHVFRARPFRLRIACENPDLEREPLRLSFRFEGEDAGSIVFLRPGVIEKRFDLGRAGALRLEVSRTFRPSAGDRRQLGVAVSAIRWE